MEDPGELHLTMHDVGGTANLQRSELYYLVGQQLEGNSSGKTGINAILAAVDSASRNRSKRNRKSLGGIKGSWTGMAQSLFSISACNSVSQLDLTQSFLAHFIFPSFFHFCPESIPIERFRFPRTSDVTFPILSFPTMACFPT
jgi:hypothetical protein